MLNLERKFGLFLNQEEFFVARIDDYETDDMAAQCALVSLTEMVNLLNVLKNRSRGEFSEHSLSTLVDNPQSPLRIKLNEEIDRIQKSIEVRHDDI